MSLDSFGWHNMAPDQQFLDPSVFADDLPSSVPPAHVDSTRESPRGQGGAIQEEGQHFLLDRYEVRRAGSHNGEPWPAYDRVRRTDVGLIFLDHEALRPLADRVESEVRLAGGIVHENLVRVLDLHRTPEASFVVAEPLHGCTLAEELKRRRARDQRFSLEEVRRLGIRLCGAVQAIPPRCGLRRFGVSSVWITPDAAVKLLHPGVLGLFQVQRPDEHCAAPAEGLANALQDEGGPPSSADQHAIAAVLYHVLTGQPPAVPAAPPDELRSNIPSGLSRTILRALSVEPRRRFSNLDAFRRALEPTKGERSDSKWIWAALVPALALVLALLGWQWKTQAENARLRARYAEELGKIEDLQSRAQRLDSEITTDAKNARTELEKWQREFVTARDGNKPVQEEYARERLERIRPIEDRAARIAELWQRHSGVREQISDAAGQINAAAALFQEGRLAEALQKLKLASGGLSALLRWRANAAEALTLARSTEADLEQRLSTVGEHVPPGFFHLPERLLIRVPEELLEGDGSTGLASARRAAEAVPELHALLEIRRTLLQETPASRLVQEIAELRELTESLAETVATADKAAAEGRLDEARRDYSAAAGQVRELPARASELLLEVADRRVSNAEAAAALPLLEAVLSIAPELEEPSDVVFRARVLEGRAQVQNGEYTAARTAFSEALAVRPDDPDARIGRAAVCNRLKDYPAAIEDCDAVLKDNPASNQALAERAYARVKTGNLEGAVGDTDSAISLAADFSPAYAIRGLARSLQGQTGPALADLSQALHHDPRQVPAYVFRAALWHAVDEQEKAVADCTRALELHPDHPEAYAFRGAARAALGRRDEALSDFEQSLRLEPAEPRTYLLRGNAWRGMDEPDRAIADYGEALRHNPGLAEAYLERAGLHAAQGDLEAAGLDCRRTEGLLIADPRYLIKRARLWFNLQELDKSLEDCERAVTKLPASAEPWAIRASIRYARGQYQESLADATRAVELDAKLVRGYTVRALSALKLGQHDQTIADCTKALQWKPELVECYLTRAAAWLAKEDYDRAIADCDEAIRRNPRSVEAFRTRALSWFKKGDQEKANADYSTALRLAG